MTEDEAIEKLKTLKKDFEGDTEKMHSHADSILLDFIESTEYRRVAFAWRDLDKKTGFWYA